MILTDQHNRFHDYLRISLTDQCNFRCVYCMPHENMQFMPRKHLMQHGEILEIAKLFVELGVKKIRLTGGEPLLRKDFAKILQGISDLGVYLTLTTNGILLDKYMPQIKAAGITSLNISLDSLNPNRFNKITQRNAFSSVWDNIMLALEEGIKVKINVVAKKGIIEPELEDFIQITQKLPLHVRFIEFMPFDGNAWNSQNVVTAKQLLRQVEATHDIVKLKDAPHATAKKYKVIGHEGTFAFITTMSEHFCGSCNRLRLTADGKIKNCLFGKKEVDLLQALREGGDLVPLIQDSVQSKYAVMGNQFPQGFKETNPKKIENRSMIAIGG